jgi:hypothetical protein
MRCRPEPESFLRVWRLRGDMGGIRAELTVESPPDCPTARASDAAGGTARSVTKSVPADPDEPVTEEFVLDVEIDPGSEIGGTTGDSPL